MVVIESARLAKAARWGLALLAASLFSGSVAAQVKPLPDALTLYAGEAAVHRVDGALKRVAVGNGGLVEVKTLGRSELVIIANAPGDTSMHLWMRDGTQRDIAVQVIAGNTNQTAPVVRELLAGVAGIQVLAVGGNIVITGADVDAAGAQRIAAVQKLYPQVVNFSSADPVGMRPTVLMDVQVMEFDRNALEELGIRWDSAIAGPNGGLVKDFTTNDYYRLAPEDGPFAELDLPLKVAGTQAFMGIATSIASRINLLVNKGKAFALASPQLSARSGGTAEFLAGGEVPIPVSSPFGQTQVTFKEYGIRLHIEPVVNEANEISATMMTEVSRIDPSVTVAGVPGFVTRRAKTEINVRSGETIVLSGLTDLNAAKSADKFPLLGDVPVLGRLFRSDNFRANRTDLVIFVTPRVVMPQSPENQAVLERGQRIRDDFDATLGKDLAE